MTNQRKSPRRAISQGSNKKTRRNRTSPTGTRPKSQKLVAEFGPKPNFMNWRTYHYLAKNRPEDLKAVIRRSLELKADRAKQEINREWPLGQKPDHVTKSEYHRLARKAPWELQELCLKMYSGPAVLAPEQRVFKPSRKLDEEEKRKVANAYGILLSRPDGMDIYLARLWNVDPSLVGWEPPAGYKEEHVSEGTMKKIEKERAINLSGENFASQKASSYRLRRPSDRGHFL